MGIIAEAYGKGDFKRLVYPKGKFNQGTTDRSVDRKFRFLDSSGRICGYDFGVHDKPYLMYYNPLACLDSGLPGEG